MASSKEKLNLALKKTQSLSNDWFGNEEASIEDLPSIKFNAMFEFLLALAFIIALLIAYFYFFTGNTDARKIVTKLELFNNELCEAQSANEFPCELKHSGGKVDQLMAIPSSITDNTSTPLGGIPYDYKARILHYMNTKHLKIQTSFNKSTKELTIDLIDELEETSN